MTPNTPRISWPSTPDGARVLSGSWTAARLADPGVWPQIQASLNDCQATEALRCAWDLRELERLDHTGAQVLWNAWRHQWPTDLLMNDSQRPMLERVARYSTPPPQATRRTPLQVFLSLGAQVWRLLDHGQAFVRLLGQLLLDMVQLARHPRSGPWRDVSGHLHHIGATALPITALVGFLIGVVLAYLMSLQLRQFGADAFIVNILGISLIRELGPVLAAILIAGR